MTQQNWLVDMIADDKHRLAWLCKSWLDSNAAPVELPDGIRTYGIRQDGPDGEIYELIEHSSLPVTYHVVGIPRVKIIMANGVWNWEAA